MSSARNQPCGDAGPIARAAPEAEPSAQWKLDRLMGYLAAAWFCGGWKAETHGERQMQAMLEDAGWWPINSEAALIAVLDDRVPDRGANPEDASAPEPSAVLKTMTITLTDAEMVAMEECMRVAALSQRAVFRQALGGLQIKVREAVSGPIADDRMPRLPNPQDGGTGGGEEVRPEPTPNVTSVADGSLATEGVEGSPSEDDICPHCGDGDRVPSRGYWCCPLCDAEWNVEDDELPDVGSGKL